MRRTQMVAVSEDGEVAIPGLRGLTDRVRQLDPPAREEFLRRVARAALATQMYVPPDALEAVAEDLGLTAPEPSRTQVDCLRTAGYDPVALGGKIVDGEVYKPDADPRHRGPCANCGAPGVWISGAGRYLCACHQDDY